MSVAIASNKSPQRAVFLHLLHVSIDDNPIESLDINKDQFPRLKKIKCGSSKLKFLGFELLQITHGLEKEYDSGLTINLVPEFRNCLLLPPFSVITTDGTRDAKGEIQRYLKRPDLYLNQIKDIALRLEGLQWLVKNFPSFETFFLIKTGRYSGKFTRTAQSNSDQPVFQGNGMP